MKNSGIEWIGEIPDDWALIRFKDIFINRKEIAGTRSFLFDRLALTMNGVIKRDKDDSDGLQPKEFDGYQIIYENDFIFKMIDLQNISTSRVGLSPYTGLVSPAYICFSPRKKGQYNLFVYYFLMSLYYNCVYNNLGGNGVRSALNATDMGQFLIPFPSTNTQIQIVSMIENRCAAVERLITNQQEQIEKLKEYKQSVISEAVTRGLDPSVPMKDSGIEWVGNIPSHWRVSPNKYLMKKRKDICSIYKGNNILSLTMKGVVIRDLDAGGKMPSSFDGYQKIKRGNLLMCLFDIDVTPRCVGLIECDGVTSPAYSQFIMSTRAVASYYNYYYLMVDYTKELLHMAKNLRHSLTEDQFGLILSPQPPISEQQQIADYLDEKCAEIDKLISIKQQKIETLTEYKKSLIYEYVTGKKQVLI